MLQTSRRLILNFAFTALAKRNELQPKRQSPTDGSCCGDIEMNNKLGRACADDGSTVGAKAPPSLRSAFVAAETLALGAALAAGSAGVAQAAAATTAAASNDVQAVEVLS